MVNLMRNELAERLLAEVMNWRPEILSKERPELQALATMKYDGYEQFSPGMRFVESLALWLAQFELDEEREKAYEFVKSKLVFFSDAEMAHFISMAYPEFIRPMLIRRAAKELSVPDYSVRRVLESTQYRVLLRRSIFLGMSDGAHTDAFRRFNPEISHEQVWMTYDVSEEKASDWLDKLGRSLESIQGKEPEPHEKTFQMIFLLDDFVASGRSYFRKDGPSEFSGKIYKVLSEVCKEDHLHGLVNPEDLHICVLLYVGTVKALDYLKRMVHDWMTEMGCNIPFDIISVQVIPDETRVADSPDSIFTRILEKYFDPSIIDKHYLTGKHDKPYFGYDECGLPLVLNHNTPNNSVPLLWFPDGMRFRGLFPRASRHWRER